MNSTARVESGDMDKLGQALNDAINFTIVNIPEKDVGVLPNRTESGELGHRKLPKAKSPLNKHVREKSSSSKITLSNFVFPSVDSSKIEHVHSHRRKSSRLSFLADLEREEADLPPKMDLVSMSSSESIGKKRRREKAGDSGKILVAPNMKPPKPPTYQYNLRDRPKMVRKSIPPPIQTTKPAPIWTDAPAAARPFTKTPGKKRFGVYKH